LKKYFKNANFLFGFIFLTFILLVVLWGFIALPYDINAVNIQERLLPFTKNHLLGTDHLGRDILSRIMVYWYR
jgi:ABC-type dipeptide/oligopeptide/nickel transport system permease subunit